VWSPSPPPPAGRGRGGGVGDGPGGGGGRGGVPPPAPAAPAPVAGAPATAISITSEQNQEPCPGPSGEQRNRGEVTDATGGGDNKMIMDVLENMLSESQTCFDLGLSDPSVLGGSQTRLDSPSSDSPSMPPSPQPPVVSRSELTHVADKKGHESGISTPSPIDVGEEIAMKVEGVGAPGGTEEPSSATSTPATTSASQVSVDLSRLLEIAERLAAEKSGSGGHAGGAGSSSAASGIGRRTSAFKAVAPATGVSGESLCRLGNLDLLSLDPETRKSLPVANAVYVLYATRKVLGPPSLVGGTQRQESCTIVTVQPKRQKSEFNCQIIFT